MVDFSIDAEFQEKLDWMSEFVRTRVHPLEYIYDYDIDAPYDVSNEGLRKVVRRLQQEVKEHGLWAAHLPPHLGGQGYGAVKLTYIEVVRLQRQPRGVHDRHVRDGPGRATARPGHDVHRPDQRTRVRDRAEYRTVG